MGMYIPWNFLNTLILTPISQNENAEQCFLAAKSHELHLHELHNCITTFFYHKFAKHKTTK